MTTWEVPVLHTFFCPFFYENCLGRPPDYSFFFPHRTRWFGVGLRTVEIVAEPYIYLCKARGMSRRIRGVGRVVVGCDHTSTKAPDPIRTLKLSVLGQE